MVSLAVERIEDRLAATSAAEDHPVALSSETAASWKAESWYSKANVSRWFLSSEVVGS